MSLRIFSRLSLSLEKLNKERRRFPVLVIHGGAGRRLLDQERSSRLKRKLALIRDRAYAVLVQKGAVQAVVEAVRLMENDPAFNAGRGSQLQLDGRARLTASVMDGRRERFASVINLEGIRNPVQVAHALLGEDHRILAGEGALLYARSKKFRVEETRTQASVGRWRSMVHARKKSSGADTVGACALDRFGGLASATSTGGMGMEHPGRVSDSGMSVANFAGRLLAVSATGVGEEIIEAGLALRIATRYEDGGTLSRAFYQTFTALSHSRRRMGAIGVDRNGLIEAATTTETLLFSARKGNRKVLLM